MEERVSHKGIVTKVTEKDVEIKVISGSSCGSCNIKSACDSKLTYSLGSIETFMRMVENGQGVTFIPELALSQLSDKQMRLVRPFALPIPVRDVVLLTTKTFVRHSMAELIIKSVKDNVPQSMLTYNNTEQRI